MGRLLNLHPSNHADDMETLTFDFDSVAVDKVLCV